MNIKSLIILFYTAVYLGCYVQNQIKIGEVYFQDPQISKDLYSRKLIKKRIKVCTQSVRGLITDFEPHEEYDKLLHDLLDKAFSLSNYSPWYNVELYNYKDSCKILEGKYYEK